jgi:hypothetical protein
MKRAAKPSRNVLKKAVRTLRRMPRPNAVEKREPIEIPLRDRD